MSLLVDQSGAPDMVLVSGDLQLASAAQGRETLLGAIRSCKNLKIALCGKSELDLAALQLLLAAEREAANAGVSYEYEEATAAMVNSAMEQAGLYEQRRQAVVR